MCARVHTLQWTEKQGSDSTPTHVTASIHPTTYTRSVSTQRDVTHEGMCTHVVRGARLDETEWYIDQLVELCV